MLKTCNACSRKHILKLCREVKTSSDGSICTLSLYILTGIISIMLLCNCYNPWYCHTAYLPSLDILNHCLVVIAGLHVVQLGSIPFMSNQFIGGLLPDLKRKNCGRKPVLMRHGYKIWLRLDLGPLLPQWSNDFIGTISRGKEDHHHQVQQDRWMMRKEETFSLSSVTTATRMDTFINLSSEQYL